MKLLMISLLRSQSSTSLYTFEEGNLSGKLRKGELEFFYALFFCSV